MLRFQDGPYIPATPPKSANSGHKASGAPGMTSTANGITPEAALAAIGDHLEALTAKTGDPELGEAFDHVRHAIARLNQHRQRVERPKPAKGVDATVAPTSDGSAPAEQQAIELSGAGNLESGSRQQSGGPVEPQAPPATAQETAAHTRPEPIPPDPALRQMRRLTRRGFATGAIAALTGAAGWGWLRSRRDVGRNSLAAAPDAGMESISRARIFSADAVSADVRDNQLPNAASQRSRWAGRSF